MMKGAFLLYLVSIACAPRRELDAAEQRLLLVSRHTPAQWEIPATARAAGPSPYLVLQEGEGTARAEPGKFYVCNLTYVTYDDQGRQLQIFPANLQDFDGFRPQMRAVLAGMRAGEIRRAWMIYDDGARRIVDVEMTGLWIDKGD